MDYHQAEDQQVEALKRWWKDNGNALLIGIGLALAVVFGWRAYQNQQANMRYEASSIYQQLLEASAKAATMSGEEKQKSLTTIDLLAEKLEKGYGGTGYVVLSQFILASRFLEENKLDEAIGALRKIEQSEMADDSLKSIAQIRLAKLLAQKSEFDQAISLLDGIQDKAFLAEAMEVKGDVLLEKGDKSSARKAFEKSKALSEEAKKPVSPLLEMKLSYLTEKQGL